MHNVKQTVMSVVLGVAVGLVVGLGGVSLSPAVAGSLEPPADAVNGGGDPAPTMKTLDQIPPTWSQIFPASKRFELVMGGEAVLDKNTGLVWMQSPLTQTHTVGLSAFNCFQRTTGARKGWRLPSVHELASLLDPTIPFGNLHLPAGHPFESDPGVAGVQLSAYWTSTSPGTPSFKWIVDFNSGRVHTSSGTERLPIWCVRGGGPLSKM